MIYIDIQTSYESEEMSRLSNLFMLKIKGKETVFYMKKKIVTFFVRQDRSQFYAGLCNNVSNT